MEIRPTYLIMVTTNNNNKYYNCFPEGDSFRVEYGRVDATKTVRTYPISKWDSQISAKIKKGYQDVTDLKQDLVEEVTATNQDSPYKDIENIVIKRIVDKLQQMAKDTINKNYTVKASAVTQAMVDEAQKVLDALTTIDNIKEFNNQLLKLFVVIPRKMHNVNSHTAKDKDDFVKIISTEQDLLDVMRGQIYVPVVSTKDNECEICNDKQTILEHFKLSMSETSPSEVDMIKKLLGDDANMYRNSWCVSNLETESLFDKFVQENDITDRRLLWHGSRSENFWNIIKTGLKIRPSNAVYTGSMFGDGVYFAPKARKSIGYTSLSGSYWVRGNQNVAYMALFELAYGNPYVIYNHDSTCYSMNYEYLQKQNPTCNCLHAKADKGMLRNDEIVFYRTDQMTIRYLVEIGR